MNPLTAITKHAALLTCAACLPLSAPALTIGSSQRTATVELATAGQTGLGNPLASDINSEFPTLAPWTLRSNFVGDEDEPNGTDGLLTITLTGGNWGSGEANGTWSLASSFWTLYDNAVLSLHVGNGGGDPDHFSFLIQQGETSGTWAYDKINGGGGGLSNIRLFSSDTPNTVPDGGSTLALLGVAFAGIGVLRRKIVKTETTNQGT